MTNKKTRSPLLVEEDWWTVWFGLTILLVATVLGILTLSGSITAKKAPNTTNRTNAKWVRATRSAASESIRLLSRALEVLSGLARDDAAQQQQADQIG